MAEALLIVSALFWIPVATTGLDLVWLAVYVLFSLRAFGGRPTARNAVLGTVILLSLWMTLFVVVYAQVNPWVAVTGVLALTSSWAGVMLLYRPPSNAYFRMSEHASYAQPGSITAAGFLLVLSALAWAPLVNDFLLQVMGLLLLVYVVFALLAVGGRRKARSMVTIAATLLMVQLLPFAWWGFTNPTPSSVGQETAVVDILAIAASCAGLLLLYLRGNDAYFHNSEERRRLRKASRRR
ncbi:hypothetical protein ACIBO5_08220 [Nonomuraea angiospora]|uniref:hypothetical protein n=1 Tax=Nonomuraea angiospora TaxID=46172 RepID=UPI0029BAD28B|nr:hypothetical protein [Nonomuraea angiospora]MDX3102073.1 hypothetical protein [Nonomuraea angiospora]